MCSINHDKKAIYIHIPKTGGSFIRDSLKNYYGFKPYYLKRPDHNQFCRIYDNSVDKHENKIFGTLLYYKTSPHLNRIMNMDQEKWNNYFIFTFVRNPYDRFASAYKHLHSIELVDTPFVEWVPRAIESLYTGNWSASLDAGHQYIQHLHIVNPGFDASILFKHQYSYLRPEVEVHKLEEGTIWERLGIERGFHNVSQKHYETEYSIQNSILVRDYYERDFEELGY